MPRISSSTPPGSRRPSTDDAPASPTPKAVLPERDSQTSTPRSSGAERTASSLKAPIGVQRHSASALEAFKSMGRRVTASLSPRVQAHNGQAANEEAPRQEARSAPPLSSCLMSREFCAAFETFLKRGHANENLMFLSAWHQLVDIAQDEPGPAYAQAMTIMDRFVHRNSEMEVNVPDEMRQAVIDEVIALDRKPNLPFHDFFCALQAVTNEVFKLVLRDNYSRFQSTPECRELLAKNPDAILLRGARSGDDGRVADFVRWPGRLVTDDELSRWTPIAQRGVLPRPAYEGPAVRFSVEKPRDSREYWVRGHLADLGLNTQATGAQFDAMEPTQRYQEFIDAPEPETRWLVLESIVKAIKDRPASQPPVEDEQALCTAWNTLDRADRKSVNSVLPIIERLSEA